MVTPRWPPPPSSRAFIGGALALAWSYGCAGWFGAREERLSGPPAFALMPDMPEQEGAPPEVAKVTPAPAVAAQEQPSAPAELAVAPKPAELLEAALAPALRPELDRARHRAQDRVLGFEASTAPEVLPYAPVGFQLAASTSPQAAFGRFVPVQNEAALSRFHAALAALAAGDDDDGKVRILAYGASHTQADLYTGYLRSYLQNRFGDGGQGFVLLGRVNRWYRTLDTYATHHGASVIHARGREGLKNEPLGLFGAAFVGKYGNSSAEIVTSKSSTNTRFEVQYLTAPNGGRFTLSVDGNKLAELDSRADVVRPAYHRFKTTPGQHRISVRAIGNGAVRWFGVVAESETPGVVVDTLGISGSRITDQLRWNEQHWADAFRRRAPDLVTFAYGTNETKDTNLSLASYESDLRAVLSRLRRTAPEVSCVLISPFDLSASDRPRLLRIHDAQRRISREFNCGFWDGYAFMGGEGGMRRWIYAKPPLASSDGVHLTKRGYVYTGIALGDALMRAYDAPALNAPDAQRLADSASGN